MPTVPATVDLHIAHLLNKVDISTTLSAEHLRFPPPTLNWEKTPPSHMLFSHRDAYTGGGQVSPPKKRTPTGQPQKPLINPIHTTM